jgi:ubiquinone/menaquinone biosynthesis C-methylase UbiE
MTVEFGSREISEKYNRFARWYDWLEGSLNLLGLSRLRRMLLRRVSGKVLEVAVGTGKNLPYYPPDCRLIALDLSREMLNIARKRTAKLGLGAAFLIVDAEALPFSDKHFDTVVSSLSTCTFTNPVAALEEMARVCRDGGKILLLEHGRSDHEWLGRRRGCHWV